MEQQELQSALSDLGQLYMTFQQRPGDAAHGALDDEGRHLLLGDTACLVMHRHLCTKARPLHAMGHALIIRQTALIVTLTAVSENVNNLTKVSVPYPPNLK